MKPMTLRRPTLASPASRRRDEGDNKFRYKQNSVSLLEHTRPTVPALPRSVIVPLYPGLGADRKATLCHSLCVSVLGTWT